jgi:hypothetical protein
LASKGARAVAEPKPFASLSSGLLARKGAARPAMRPQGFGQGAAGLEDLGWNDMGFEPPKPATAPRDATHDAFGEDVVGHPRVHPTGLTPIHSPVHDQQAEIVERLNVVEEAAEADSDDSADSDDIGELYQLEIEQADADETAELYETEIEEADADETAELYEPEADQAPIAKVAVPEPVIVPATTPASRRAPRPRAAAGSKGKAAFTLRLDPDRHLKLRLACAVDRRSAQQLVTDALDHLLERMPDLDGLAAKAKRRG